MSPIFIFSLTLLVTAASCKGKTAVTDKRDYQAFLTPAAVKEEVKKVTTEIDFWQQRLQKDTGSYVNLLELAGQQLRLFRLTGNISALRAGDSVLKRSSAKLNDTEPEILYALSQHSITQHRFAAAAAYTRNAEKMKGDQYTIRLLEFDIHMELGQYPEAYRNLQSLKDRSAFDYLVRRAKWEDHLGNLEGAIGFMEEAFEKIREGKKSLYCWTLSNLGDMYGHAGRIQDAYRSYLAVLKKDPSNLYCLKGIAWIAYSQDQDFSEAKRILRFILSQSSMPELKLLLAEIAESEGRLPEKEQYLREFVSTVSDPAYGDMYNQYLVKVYAEEPGTHHKALALAEKELQNRFTPETCDGLAWVYFNKGDTTKALEYARGYVYKRTYEPEALMHTAFIFAAAGKTEEARQLLEECLESAFELGPVATGQVREKLNTL